MQPSPDATLAYDRLSDPVLLPDATGLPVGTAKCYAHRGRNRLRARLSA